MVKKLSRSLIAMKSMIQELRSGSIRSSDPLFIPVFQRGIAPLCQSSTPSPSASGRRDEWHMQRSARSDIDHYELRNLESPFDEPTTRDKSRRIRKSEHHRRFNKEDFEIMPDRIILLRHGESQGNVERNTYCLLPDHSVPLTDKGRDQAQAAGKALVELMQAAHYESGGDYSVDDDDFRVFFLTSPYARTLATTDMLLEAFTDEQVAGVRAAVQLREQDFGNFQDPKQIDQDMNERIKFGRFWFRFPNGESGADVYDRITLFEDHLVRDMIIGRYAGVNLVLVTHGLTLRIFLMKWFHWTVEEMLEVYNPRNCEPIVMQKLPWNTVASLQGKNKYMHAKQCYQITPASMARLRGCDGDMASYVPRKIETLSAKARWVAKRARSQYYKTASRVETTTTASGQEAPTAVMSVIRDTQSSDGRLLDPTMTGGAEVEDPLASEDEMSSWWRGQARFNVDD